jgi:hypothetical protein
LLAAAPGHAAQTTADADVLYRQRDQPAVAGQVAEMLTAQLAAREDFEVAWRLARVLYWIGTHGPKDGQRAALDRGVVTGTLAARLEPNRPEGHFWQAANMGALAESFGLSQGLKYRGRIKAALDRVRAIDPAWQQGSADRALGWWYHMVPGLFGGSESEAEAHLRRALTYNAESTATLYFLAEVLIERGRPGEARATLQKVLDAPWDPDWAPEDAGFKEKAAARLRTLRSQ